MSTRSKQALGFLILEMHTGAMDGWYFDEAMARGAIASLRGQFPKGRWVLLRRVTDTGSRKGETSIPRLKFWVDALHRMDA